MQKWCFPASTYHPPPPILLDPRSGVSNFEHHCAEHKVDLPYDLLTRLYEVTPASCSVWGCAELGGAPRCMRMRTPAIDAQQTHRTASANLACDLHVGPTPRTLSPLDFLPASHPPTPTPTHAGPRQFGDNRRPACAHGSPCNHQRSGGRR